MTRVRAGWASIAAAIVALSLFAVGAEAQSFPNRPLRWIVPFPAGGPADILSRIVAERLADNLGQRILIDNRAGASGIIGTELAVKAQPDGTFRAYDVTGSSFGVVVSMDGIEPRALDGVEPDAEIADVVLTRVAPATRSTTK